MAAWAKVLIKNWQRLLDSPGKPRGEKGKKREKSGKEEKGLDYCSWKPEADFFPLRKKPGEEPEDSRDSVDSGPLSPPVPKAIDGKIKQLQIKGRDPTKYPAAARALPLPPSSASWQPAISQGTLCRTSVWRCSQWPWRQMIITGAMESVATRWHQISKMVFNRSSRVQTGSIGTACTAKSAASRTPAPLPAVTAQLGRHCWPCCQDDSRWNGQWWAEGGEDSRHPGGYLGAPVAKRGGTNTDNHFQCSKCRNGTYNQVQIVLISQWLPWSYAMKASIFGSSTDRTPSQDFREQGEEEQRENTKPL